MVTAFVTIPEVQQWLDPSRLTLAFIDEELEETARIKVFSTLADKYVTEDWVSAVTTPDLIRKIIALLVASWTYRRTYAEDGGDSSYAGYLELSANRLLGGLLEGSINLPDDETIQSSSYPSFWPTDLATAYADEYDPGSEFAAPRAFTMGKVF